MLLRFWILSLSTIIFASPFLLQLRQHQTRRGLIVSTMSSNEDTTVSSSGGHDKIPLINLPSVEEGSADIQTISTAIVDALKTSGFLLVTSPLLPSEMQQSVLEAARTILVGSNDDATSHGVIRHPTDPKVYMMLESPDDIEKKCTSQKGSSSLSTASSQLLKDYWAGLETIKRQILEYIAIGLGLHVDSLVNLHTKNQSAIRLLHYYPEKISEPGQLTIRGKAHSDYGSITLLLTDGVPGLQALVDGQWIPVPYIKGSLVVNIGSLLQEWSSNQLLATLHRVISVGRMLPRTSLAFFADLDSDISLILKEREGKSIEMSVAEYVQWRSGGAGAKRSGVSFSNNDEEERANQAN